jgi:hypothetical protein
VIRSRFTLAADRRLFASMTPAKLNLVERLMTTLETIFGEWGVLPPDEQTLELGAQILLRSVLHAPPTTDRGGERVIGVVEKAGEKRVISVHPGHAGVEIHGGPVPYHLVGELVLRLLGS